MNDQRVIFVLPFVFGALNQKTFAA